MYFGLDRRRRQPALVKLKGEPTAGIYGFARELVRILEQENQNTLLWLMWGKL
jgi:hypothetical protein